MNVGRDVSRVVSSIEQAAQLDLSVTSSEALAFEIFSASHEAPAESVRFLMLMVAVETLIAPRPRDLEVVAHVDDLIRRTKELELSKAERNSLVGSLKWLRDESINQAGRRLAATLGGRRYAETEPASFFSGVTVRSGLVHGSHPPPSVEGLVTELESFICDLLSVRLGYSPE